MQEKTRLLKTPPPSPIHLRALFQDCWEIGCPNVACIYYLRWFLPQGPPATKSERITLLSAMPTSFFYQLRTKFEGRNDLRETLCRLIPVGTNPVDSHMDDAQASLHAALVDDIIALINLPSASILQSKDEPAMEQLPPPNTSANNASGVAVKKLLNVLRSNNSAGRQLEAYLLRGIQSYRQGRFEEALSVMHLILTSNPSQPRPPSRDRSSGRGANLNDTQVCIATAQQIRTYSKIALFLMDGSETHRPTDADLSVLIPDKELLFPTQSDLERVASYYLKHGQYLELSKQYFSLAETFANEAESLTPISCIFFSLLGQLFDKVFSFFKKDIRELGIEKIASSSTSDIVKLQEIREKAKYLLDCTAKTKESHVVIESAIRALTSINAYECIYVLCGLFYSYALKSCTLQPFVFNTNCFGAMAVIMASPNFLPPHSKLSDVVNKIEAKTNVSVEVPGSTQYSELFLPLATFSLPYLPKKVDVCLGLFQAYALNGRYKKALRYFWEYASLISLCFSSISDLQNIFKSTNFSLALTCMQKLGAPTLLAAVLQLKRETLYAEAFSLLSKTAPLIISESYIPFLWDSTLIEYLCGYVWKDSPSTRKLLAGQLASFPQGQAGSSYLPEHLIQKLLINIEKDYLS
ncbi:hypothetical protein DSO57_1000046 [Entomophthora muscae]|uniref:Uncharacterized protein n=1 Tax=Entomophthora muscae TaxID=34485 RepID=A0ACC2SMR3_9FUNG|nr:hypothetical protein DSO57_1000046 [Entomophthora muscae]